MSAFEPFESGLSSWEAARRVVHHHRAYGMSFRSAIAIPELTVDADVETTDRAAEIRISFGRTPAHLEDPRHVEVGVEANADQFLMQIDGVARYLVSFGSQMVIEPAVDVDPHELRVFLLGTCMGVLLHQRGFLVLHASGFGTERGAVLFAGASGSGKSTLLAEMLRRGRRMMVDDVCAISATEDADPVVRPSYPRTRMWADAAERLAIDTSGLARTRPTMDKYERQLPEQFWDRAAPLARLYHLAGTSHDELSLTRVGRTEAFGVVTQNTYRRSLLDGLGRRQEHFRLASRIASRATVVRVIRPTRSFRLQELADLIEPISRFRERRRRSASAPRSGVGTARLDARVPPEPMEVIMLSIPPEASVSRRDHLLTNDLSANEIVMLDIEAGTYFGLQDVGKAIWDQLETPVTVVALCEHLVEQFEVEPETCRIEVESFLNDLLEQGMIEVHGAPHH